MTVELRTRFFSVPTIKKNTPYFEKKIYSRDLKMFVAKYKKERCLLRSFFELPPEIYLMDIIANKYESRSHQDIISEDDKETILAMIKLNFKYRDEHKNQTPRLRDKIIDRMLEYFSSELKYMSLKDYI